MEIDFSLAPNDATHYMIQEGKDDYYWFFNIKKDYLIVVASIGNHRVVQRHHVEKEELEKCLEGHYSCVCTEMNLLLENE